MKCPAVVVASLLAACILPAAGQTDVPAGNWAAASVKRVVSSGLLASPGGRFNGSKPLMRADLTVALHRLAVRLKATPWPTDAVGVKALPLLAKPAAGPTSRYEAAWVIDRVAACTEATLTRPLVAPRHKSTALPPAIAPAKLPKGAPSQASLRYLAAHRMVWPKSPLLKAGNGPVTGTELADAVAEMLAGFMAECTDEPELLEMDRAYRSGGHGAKRLPLKQSAPQVK